MRKLQLIQTLQRLVEVTVNPVSYGDFSNPFYAVQFYFCYERQFLIK